MKTFISYVLVAMLFAAGCASVPRDVVKVGTYNIRLSGANGRADRGTPNAWKERKEDLLELVRKLDLDVFGLQEVCPDQAKFLRDNLAGYEFVGEHRNADRTSGEASPVCYRKSRFEALGKGTFWLSETPDTPGLKGWGAACRASARISFCATVRPEGGSASPIPIPTIRARLLAKRGCCSSLNG